MIADRVWILADQLIKVRVCGAANCLMYIPYHVSVGDQERVQAPEDLLDRSSLALLLSAGNKHLIKCTGAIQSKNRLAGMLTVNNSWRIYKEPK